MSSQIVARAAKTAEPRDGRPAHPLRRAMDALYRLCAIIAGSALVLISLVVPWGVYTRYVLDSASSWPEPMAILLSIVLTFFGAAAWILTTWVPTCPATRSAISTGRPPPATARR